MRLSSKMYLNIFTRGMFPSVKIIVISQSVCLNHGCFIVMDIYNQANLIFYLDTVEPNENVNEFWWFQLETHLLWHCIASNKNLEARLRFYTRICYADVNTIRIRDKYIYSKFNFYRIFYMKLVFKLFEDHVISSHVDAGKCKEA